MCTPTWGACRDQKGMSSVLIYHSSLYSFETGSLTKPEVRLMINNFQQSFASTPTMLRLQVSATKPCFLLDSRDLNSGPYPVQQMLLPTEPFLQPQPLIFSVIYKIRGLN